MACTIKHGVVLAAISLLATAGTAQASQFIVNGNFSSPNTGGGFTNQSPVPGWTDLNEAGGLVEVGNSAIYGLPCISTGCQNAEVDNNTFGNLQQTVTGLIGGDSYTLSFDYGVRNSGGPDAMDIYFGGTLLGENDETVNGWYMNSYTITATSSTEALNFVALNLGGSPSYGNEVTNVSLIGAAVPEPATWAMMLVGFVMLGAALRRKATPVRVTYA